MKHVHTISLPNGKTYTWRKGRRRTDVFVRNLIEAHRVESGPLAEVTRLQEGLLHDLIERICPLSPFWTARLADADTWDQVPILDRASLGAQVASEGPLGGADQDMKKTSTSGSTGRAVEFYRTARASYMYRLRYALDHLEQGRDLSKKMAITRHNALTRESNGWLWPTDLDKYLPSGPATAANHKRKPIPDLARWLRKAEPAYLFTTPPVLDLLTEVWEAEPDLVPRLELVGTFSFNLQDATREAVRRHTGARIADRYSCEEVGPIAFQCPHHDHRYHVATSNVILEIVDHTGRPAPPGELGRVLVTSLHNYATPILRYELGDLAALRNGCECGHAGPVITQLAGRARSLISLGPGQYRYFSIVASQWTQAAPLREYRVLQVALGRLEAELVADVRLDEEALGRVQALIAANSPAGFEIGVRQVEAIDWGPGYKRLEFQCLI